MKKRNRLNSCVFLIIVLLLSSVVSAQQNIDINVITFNYKKQPEALSLVKIEKSSGYAPEYTVSTTAYKLDIISTTDKVLKTMRFSPPVEETAFKGFTTTESTNIVKFTISIPYFSNAKLINVYDKNNEKVVEIPLKSSTSLPKTQASSQKQMPKQEKVEKMESNPVITNPLNFVLVNLAIILLGVIGILVIVGSIAYRKVKKKREHSTITRKP